MTIINPLALKEINVFILLRVCIILLQGQALTWNEIQATIDAANSQAEQAVQGKDNSMPSLSSVALIGLINLQMSLFSEQGCSYNCKAQVSDHFIVLHSSLSPTVSKAVVGVNQALAEEGCDCTKLLTCLTVPELSYVDVSEDCSQQYLDKLSQAKTGKAETGKGAYLYSCVDYQANVFHCQFVQNPWVDQELNITNPWVDARTSYVLDRCKAIGPWWMDQVNLELCYQIFSILISNQKHNSKLPKFVFESSSGIKLEM